MQQAWNSTPGHPLSASSSDPENPGGFFTDPSLCSWLSSLQLRDLLFKCPSFILFQSGVEICSLLEAHAIFIYPIFVVEHQKVHLPELVQVPIAVIVQVRGGVQVSNLFVEVVHHNQPFLDIEANPFQG